MVGFVWSAATLPLLEGSRSLPGSPLALSYSRGSCVAKLHIFLPFSFIGFLIGSNSSIVLDFSVARQFSHARSLSMHAVDALYKFDIHPSIHPLYILKSHILMY